MISVCVITYCNEQFIAQAIEAILNQNCDHEIELIIADDCSPDNTEKIVAKTINNNPRVSIINYTRHSTNRGMINNFIWVLNQCKGKYVAICEGDDFWTDPLKLQKQVDFLEANPDYGMVSTDISLIDENGNPLPDNNMVLRQREHRKPTVGFFDLLNFNLVNTLTVVARADLMKALSERVDKENLWFVYDHWFWLNLAMSHKTKLFYEKTAAYRIHRQGVSKSKGFFEKRKPLVLRDAIFNAMKHPNRDIRFRIKVLKCYCKIILRFALARNTNAFLLMIKGGNKRG